MAHLPHPGAAARERRTPGPVRPSHATPLRPVQRDFLGLDAFADDPPVLVDLVDPPLAFGAAALAFVDPDLPLGAAVPARDAEASDWVAEEGSYIFEPPGETHTLVVPEGCTEMITLFQVNGSLMYVDPQGVSTGYDDVFTRLEKARAHYTAVGLGDQYVDQFIR